MGIDIYARWRDQSETSIRDQAQAWHRFDAGAIGYLRESYHGAPYATRFLCSESFATGKARIPAAQLRARLPRAIALSEERLRNLYNASEAQVAAVKRSFGEFVELCEEKERAAGEPVEIIAWF